MQLLKRNRCDCCFATDKPNVRPAKGSFKPFFNTGVEDWIKRNREDNSADENYPPEAALKIVNLFIDTYKNTFNAVDEQSEENNGEQDYVINYAGSVSFYYQKKKYLVSVFQKELLV